jgi:hypothetical protein
VNTANGGRVGDAVSVTETGSADPSAPDADIWSDGALNTTEAAKFVQLCKREFFALARKQGWPRRYRGLVSLFPRRLLAEYLDGLPTERKGSAAKA